MFRYKYSHIETIYFFNQIRYDKLYLFSYYVKNVAILSRLILSTEDDPAFIQSEINIDELIRHAVYKQIYNHIQI